MVFNPNKRLTATEALNHKYVAEFKNPDEEIVCEKPIHITMNDNVKGSIRDYREAL